MPAGGRAGHAGQGLLTPKAALGRPQAHSPR